MNTIDRFKIISHLGSGSYGQVYLGVYNGNKYAIKRVSLEQPMQTLWEISLYNLMSHPNIVSPFEYISIGDHRYIDIVMPEADSTLRSFIYQIPTEIDIRLIAWQLLSALDYMHTNSIVHRDLKPANILLNDTKVMVIDFGLARFIDQNLNPTSVRIQTYTYRAPEVFQAIKDIHEKKDVHTSTRTLGTAMDIWSVGMMILEMFLGTTYFHNSTRQMSEQEVSQFLLSDKYHTLISDIENLHCSGDAKDVLFALLHHDPRERVSASTAMEMPWFK